MKERKPIRNAVSDKIFDSNYMAIYRYRYILLEYKDFILQNHQNKEIFITDYISDNSISQENIKKISNHFNDLLNHNVKHYIHEKDHHTKLVNSYHWIYMNICISVIRLLSTEMIFKKKISNRIFDFLIELKCDILKIQLLTTIIDESRLSLKENENNRYEKIYKKFFDSEQTDIELLKRYKSLYLLKETVTRDCIYDNEYKELLNLSLPENEKINKLTIPFFFIKRYFRELLPTICFIFRRFLDIRVFFFAVKVLYNVIRKYNSIVKLPMYRSFLPSGMELSIDPGAGFVGKKFASKSFEANILQKHMNEESFNYILWVNYIIDKYCRDKYFKQDTNTLQDSNKNTVLDIESEYRFFARIIFLDEDSYHDLIAIDRICSKYSVIKFKKDIPIEDVINIIKRKITESWRHNVIILYNYLKLYYYHGA